MASSRARLPVLLSTCALAALVLGGVARAQAGPPPGVAPAATTVEEIVVSARRREERLIDVPVAITAMTPTRLDQFAATDLVKIAQLAPNVVITPSGNGSGAAISIRGIGSTAADAGVDQTVTVQLDGIPIGRGRIINVAMFDLRSVEILKGPQALFFGKNSPGGVISVNSVDPGREFEGYARFGYQTRSEQRYFEGAVTVPLSDDLSARLAVRADKGDGFITNTAGPIASPFQPGTLLPGRPAERGEKVNVVGRLTVKYQPNDQFSATFKGLLARSYEKNSVPTESLCAASVKPHITSVGMVDPFSDCKLDWRSSLGTVPAQMALGWPLSRGGKPFSDVKSQLYGLTLNYSAGLVDLTSVTSFYKFTSENWAPLAGSVSAFFAGTNDEWNRTFTQEFRGNTRFDGPVNFTAGLFFEDGHRRFQNTSELSPLRPDPQGRTYTDQVDFSTDNNSYSAFGQARWNIRPDLELAGGARWTREEKTGVLGNSFVNVNSPVPLLPQGKFIHDKVSDEAITPEVTLTWKPQDGLTLYGAYKTGYKSPGITNTIVITPVYNQDNTVFGPERSHGFEGGVKFSLLGHALSGDVTAFRYNFKDLQVVSFDSTTITYVVRNAAAARTQGLEAQLNWVASERLRFDGSLTLLDAKFLNFPSTACYVGQVAGCTARRDQDVSGRRLPGTPKWSGRIGGAYDQPLASDLLLNLSADLNYNGGYFGSLTYSPYTKQGAFSVVNTAVRLTRGGQPWELAVIGRNLTNEAYIISAGDIPGAALGDISATVGDPRTVTFQVTYRF
jgi:outer membrane receptor protein involved in Fe transport